MKIYISVDMEGATGIVSPLHVRAEAVNEYAFGCTMQYHDLKAVVEGALEAGATEILVNDSHARMINIDVSQLPKEVRLISGTPKALGMIEGVQGCDGAFFIAYHAMAGTPEAVLDHTVSGSSVFNVTLNGHNVGETGLNAAVCAEHHIPVALVSGDAAACREALALLGSNLITCAVKEGRSNSCATLLPPSVSFSLLKEAAKKAVASIQSKKAPVMKIATPYSLEITFKYSRQCDEVSYVPGVIRVDGRTVRMEGSTMEEMRHWMGIATSLAGSIKP
ncbi:M55 family metallopeptidase [Aminobacterium mobile]|uniref:M55 family metallopeptidase n=1 Tax=Aminobacterium mobile TaxID=81467 RepID=UPI000466AAEE|nr:M55 family metallopeptidase [Aminobacterium mobile]